MIRKITRGTSSANGEKTISCTITDPDKVIVILDAYGKIGSYNHNSGYWAMFGGNVYLSEVTTTGITVIGCGPASTGYSGTQTPSTTSITFSYQIIEFM